MPNIQTTVELLYEINMLRASLIDANEHCRSAFQVANRIATRHGAYALQSDFGALASRLDKSLKRQHETILATGGYSTPNLQNT